MRDSIQTSKALRRFLRTRPGQYLVRGVRALNRHLDTMEGPSFTLERTAAPTAVIGNAVPKSGTYLLNAILRFLNRWHDTRVHFLSGQYLQFRDGADTVAVRTAAPRAVRLLRAGQMAAAHCPWTADLSQTIAAAGGSQGVKHLVMVRDPRDIVVSYMRFVTYSPKYRHWPRARELQDFMLAFFPDDAARLSYVIAYFIRDGILNGYGPWLEEPFTYWLRFEELYPELLALDEQGFGPVLRGMIKYLELSPDQLDPAQFKDGVLGKGFTASEEEKKIGQFTRSFRDEHYELIRSPMFREAMDSLGYQS
ncbi:MAG: hypothetical protein HQ559_10440 [Lentisphaerae bacterium]|nr:hypothetical protein [Lentisphaerota bacterium]